MRKRKIQVRAAVWAAALICSLSMPAGGAQTVYAYGQAVSFGGSEEFYHAKAQNVSIELEGNVSTLFMAGNSYSVRTPSMVSFFDSRGAYNVVYEDGMSAGSGQNIVIQRYDENGNFLSKIKIPKQYSKWGNAAADENGYYYLVFAQEDTDASNSVVTCVAKYDYDGGYIGNCEIRGYDSTPYDDGSYWGTKLPFRAGTCSLAINRGVLACNYARQMYNGHQSNFIFYIDCATMNRIETKAWQVPYCSHSFDQRTLAVSDGGFLFLNHGDAYSRSFEAAKVDNAQAIEGERELFHFREGANRDHGYNETYAQLGGAAETENAFIFCAASEKTLSLDTAPTNKYYMGYSEPRNLFVQILKKDFYNYWDEELYYVEGETRSVTGTRPDSALTELWLSGSETDYGVRWLTDYDNDYYASNPQIVSISDTCCILLWEKTSHAEEDREVFYLILDEDGSILQRAVVPGVTLAGNTAPVYRNGKLYWTTASGDGRGEIHFINCSINVSEGWFFPGNGKAYWYERSVKQGTYSDPKGVMGDGTVRGREIYDPESDGWYWLDSVYDGAKAVNKEVWIPYIYQDEKEWDETRIMEDTKDSGDMAEQVRAAIRASKDGVKNPAVIGKWVRYDADGKMYKGWYTVAGAEEQIYPDQAGNTYYYDYKTGLMAKGTVTIDGQTYTFDEITGALIK